MPGEIDRSAYIDSLRPDLSEEERQEAAAEFEASLEASGAVSEAEKEEKRLALEAAMSEEAQTSALAAEELSLRLREPKKPESELKKDEPPLKMRHAVAAGAILGATGTVIAGGRLIKKGTQLVNGLFTSIERWADNKLKKHPILSKVVAIGALPFTVWGLIGPWTAGLTAPLTGWLSNKWLGKEARKSWAEQEAEEGKKQEKK